MSGCGPPTYLVLSRVTGVSYLDARKQGFGASRYEEPYGTYTARSYGCRYFVLCDAPHSTSLFRPLEQWRACYAIYGDYSLDTSYQILLSFDQLAPTHHLDCLLHGAYSRCNPS